MSHASRGKVPQKLEEMTHSCHPVLASHMTIESLWSVQWCPLIEGSCLELNLAMAMKEWSADSSLVECRHCSEVQVYPVPSLPIVCGQCSET